MIDYIEKKPDLDLSFLAVDPTDKASMFNMLQTICQDNLGGCILLTAVLTDGIFRHLQENNFASIYATKLGALVTSKEVVDFDAMDFFVEFTSCFWSLDLVNRLAMVSKYHYFFIH